MPPSAGVRLGLYEILDAIGADWMGEMYGAHGTQLERIVAIKVLPGHLVDQPELHEMMRTSRMSAIFVSLDSLAPK